MKAVKIVLMVIGGVVVVVGVLLFVIFTFVSSSSNKLVCESKEGNITQGPKMSYKFDDRVSSNDCNIDVFQWQYKYDREYCQYVTIELFEYDDHIISWTDPLTLNLYLGLQLFDVIELKLGGTLTFNPQNNGVDCGQTTLGYHENPNTTLYFSRGCSLEISDK